MLGRDAERGRLENRQRTELRRRRGDELDDAAVGVPDQVVAGLEDLQ
jgi:hypothetical protein